MGFFNSEKYLLSMYVAISIATLLILFNFVDIFEKLQPDDTENIWKDKIKSLTGFVTSDSNVLENNNSFKSHLIYYSIIGILGFFILLIIFKIFRD